MTADEPRSRPVPVLSGTLVTFRRPTELGVMLAAIADQTRLVDRLVVVDNDASAANEQAVRDAECETEYVAAPENLGPAGGLARGMQLLARDADDDDWIVTLDDDDPPLRGDQLETLLRFGVEQVERDPTTAAVGVSGVRFDRRRGRMVRLADDEIVGAVPVDSVAGNQWPMYRVGPLREVGLMRSELFFGFEELDLGLRLRDAGYAIYAHGGLWREHRSVYNPDKRDSSPSWRIDDVSWRRYYSLRNLIWILRDRGAIAGAVRVSLVTGVAKPVANLVASPSRAAALLRLTLRACRDGWTGRLGRTVDPAS